MSHIIFYSSMTSSGRTLYWHYRCSFVFAGCSTQQVGTFVIACIIVFVLAFLSSAIKPIQHLILSELFDSEENSCVTNDYELVCHKEECKTSKEYQIQHITNEQPTQLPLPSALKIIKLICSVMSAALHIFLNLILMQLNGFVIIAITCGYLSAYYLFQDISFQANPQRQSPAIAAQRSV